MLEKETQFLIDFNLNKLKSLGSQFTFEKLLNTDIHPAILQYISGELDYLIFEDRYRLLENSDFDYSGSKISEYFNLIAQEIKRTKKLSSLEGKKYIEKAILFNLSYIYQPKTELAKLIFRDNRNTKSSNEINVFFNFIYYYDYLKDVFTLYTEKRKITSINSNDFSSILNKIISELFSSQTEELVNDALYSIADFYNDGGVSKTLIPVFLIENFLKEKNLNNLIVRLNKAFPDNKKRAEIDELKFVLFSKSFIADTVEEIKQDIPVEDKEVEKEVVQASSESEPAPAEEPVKEEIKKPEDVEIKIVRRTPYGEETKTEPEKIEKEVKNSDDNEIVIEDEEEVIIEDEEEIVIEEDPVQKNKTKLQKDIFSFLTDKEIEKIVSLVFNEDRDDFANTLEKLSDCSKYDDATEILKSVFFTYRVNPYSKEAITLTNAVSNYFDQT